jgi:hypothetical protein
MVRRSASAPTKCVYGALLVRKQYPSTLANPRPGHTKGIRLIQVNARHDANDLLHFLIARPASFGEMLQ